MSGPSVGRSFESKSKWHSVFDIDRFTILDAWHPLWKAFNDAFALILYRLAESNKSFDVFYRSIFSNYKLNNCSTLQIIFASLPGVLQVLLYKGDQCYI